jgi:TonB-dependent receptor
MRDMATGRLRPNRLSYAVSLALATLVAGNAALAQEQQTAGAQADKQDEIIKVNVVATRLSQQSSIDRKKNAATAMDSIVAEDVGSLPDRNIGEAISRMAGVAVSRGDFGEGVNVTVRGNGPELTRVELDGQAIQSAGGSDMNGGGDGRGSEFRSLSADLIKSVDVVKGSTADMTEGALGGGIIIKTRTGLDFKKPFASLRVAGTQSNLNKKWEPDTNLILSDKFLDGRLGVLLNASAITLNNESHSLQSVGNGRDGYTRSIDFDNSPQKTFTFQPGTVDMNDPASTQPAYSYGGFNGATPLEIVTRSAAAQTKADCYAAFPQLTQASPQLAALSSANKNNVVNARGSELLSCLNQWNDMTPSNLRYILKRQVDKRQNLDLRTDFKVNNELTVYAKGSYSKRKVDDSFLTYGLGNISINSSFVDSATGVRSVLPGSGNYLYPGTPSWRSATYPSVGTVANIDPSTVVVDSTHHVTQFGLSNAGISTDQIHNAMETTSKYFQLGGTFKRGGLTAEFLVGDARSDFTRGDKRTTFSYTYGPATVSLMPNGLWNYTFPTNYDFTNPANYGVLKPATVAQAEAPLSATNNKYSPAYTIAQQPLRTVAPQVTFTPQIRETEERTAKLDLSYALPESVPFFKRVKSGFNLRDTMSDAWGSGGLTVQAAQGTYGSAGYVPAIVVPTNAIRGSFVGCQDTPGSLAPGGAACQYGYSQSGNPLNALYGQTVLTPQQFNDIIAASMTQPATPTKLFNGATGRPDQLINNWTQIDVDKVFSMVGAPNINFDCVKECTGSDGKVYQQPVSKVKERSQAVYLMADFGVDHIPFTNHPLPFGLELEGNLGYRYIRTKVQGTGQMTFTSVTKTASYDPNNSGAAGGTVTSSYTKNTTIDATTNDFLPIYNLAMWIVPDKVVIRYNHAKTVARPPVSRLLAAGTCTYDERRYDSNDEADMLCTTMGNPALRAQMNTNQNLSVEYYPNKDTMFSASAYKQDGKVGPNIVQGVTAVPVFAGSNVVDPATGTALSDLRFDYKTYVNGPAVSRTGVEFNTKTAFTFLPWFLRYTGFDGNFTRQKSSGALNIVDLLTGEPMPPANEAKYSYNWALWYDDGKFSARVAVQAVTEKFSCIAACGDTTANTYPALGITARPLPYSPNSPNWTDATRFIDGKIGYKWKPNIEFFVEGRNLGNATQTTSQSGVGYSDGAPMLNSYAYAGRRITIGMNFRNM